MKIAVSSEGPTLTDLVDPRFGRAGGFIVFDTVSNAVSYIDNGSSQAKARGAGIESAERMAEAGVSVVLSGYVGPKAFEALMLADIKICQNLDGMTTGEAIKNFQDGKVPFADASNKE
ncbi:NifB/NifX family molybdenum-iron cluster-binding protein [Desulfovibrio litoralis]|uniref:Predicted Fe-Mo cluster-binding protein, NifX family n=1 Tax=Desulfovibrio litoralis DSM 11393 TaxID=1121455 RepID=A0A1M7RQV6_9BACT|nr:NifB/NifX family molybdenum-iron cluster-binding protein [Desulfovibrio litoralis]SHN48551.1 Predicted Fe-Mo cluster-binding protein, NifX family [Desulfovibrio litoralis DSM 11393]